MLRNHNTLSYFKNNFKLTDAEVRADIFKNDAPVYTKIRDEIPSYYSNDSVVNDCIIADGCQIYGKVENSVLFRDVVVEKGATVKNSIVMQGTRVGADAQIEYAIVDKNVTISPASTLIGASTVPVIVHKGKTV